MSDKSKQKRDSRIRRHARVRRQVMGTPERPRLAVFRSNRCTKRATAWPAPGF